MTKFSKAIIVFFIAAFFVIFALWYITSNVLSFYGNKIETITIGNHKFQVEVVSSPDKLRQGLGGRSGLCQSCGMLFLFSQPGRYPFWMKGMRFPLDMLWMANGKVVHIEKNVPADFSGILTPPNDADQVLEINAGSADKSGIKEGYIVSF